MWGRNKKKKEAQDAELAAARAEQAKVAKLQDELTAIKPEVEARVGRLEHRIIRNNFVPSMYAALGRREAEGAEE